MRGWGWRQWHGVLTAAAAEARSRAGEAGGGEEGASGGCRLRWVVFFADVGFFTNTVSCSCAFRVAGKEEEGNIWGSGRGRGGGRESGQVRRGRRGSERGSRCRRVRKEPTRFQLLLDFNSPSLFLEGVEGGRQARVREEVEQHVHHLVAPLRRQLGERHAVDRRGAAS